jgi:uncharacterized membrane protein YeiB
VSTAPGSPWPAPPVAEHRSDGAASRAPRGAGRSRVVGVDVARGLAVLGMFAAHMWPRVDLDERLFDGRSAILFATLAGVSLGLMSGGAAPTPRGRRAGVVGSIAIRAGVLIALGLLLQAWNGYVLVILPYYGVMFLLLLVVLFAPPGVLLVLASVVTIGAPALATLVPQDSFGDSSLPGAAGIATDALLVGAYPALVWLPFLLVGLVAARSDLRSRRTQLVMLVAGTVAAAVGYSVRFLPGAAAADDLGGHALVVGGVERGHGGGVAVAVIGLLLLVTSPDRPWGRGVATALRPLSATGAQPLTVYSAHLLITAPLFFVYRTEGGSYGLPLWQLGAAVVLTLVYASLWQRFVGRGPLERAVGRLSTPWSRGPRAVTD